MDLEGQVNKWKRKYENSEKNLATLKKLAHKAVYDYEDLLRKYDQNQKQYEEIKERLEDRENQLKKLQGMLEPVYDEYSQLETKYEIEKGCRSKAEEYATKVLSENKKLKRQSQLLLDKVSAGDIKITEINFEDEPSDTTNNNESQIEHLQAMMEELQGEVAKLKHRVQVAEEDRDVAIEKEKESRLRYEQEREILKRTRGNLEHSEVQLNNMKRVSVKAYEEFSVLRDKYEKEKVLHTEAEKYAWQMLSERDAMKRQSAVLINSAMSDQRLAEALLKIEDLTKEVDSQKEQLKGKEQEVQELAETFKQEQGVTELENNIQVEEIEDLKKQLKESADYCKKFEKENEELRQKLEESLRPPPPPPPPPMPAEGFMKPLKSLIKKQPNSAEILKKTVRAVDPNYSQAIQEMMDRIKSGTALRSAARRRPSLPDSDSAMEELHAILAKDKRSHSSGDLRETLLPSPTGGAATDGVASSEFKAIFDKIQGQRKVNPGLMRDLSTIAEEKDSISPKSSADDQGGVTRM